MWLMLATITLYFTFEHADMQPNSGVVLLPAAPSPEFRGPIQNVTAAVGREAVLTCTVTELGHYKVGWMKADDQTILSLHTRVITHNPRISVTHDDNFRTWQLRIRQLKESDRGCYMCQINTNAMRKQLGCIDVQVSPDIVDIETSADVTVSEGENVTLVCKATGHPHPRILWRREDGDKLILHTGTHQAEKADTFSGSQLLLFRVARHQMGAYLCIASNDVPPTVSKRIMLNINFAPRIHVPRGLVGAPLNADAKLKCEVEAFPLSSNYWLKNGEDVLKSGYRYKIQEKRSGYKTTMVMTILNISHYDYGTYKCVGSNVMGQNDDTVRLYEIKIPTTTTTTTTTVRPFFITETITFMPIATSTTPTSTSILELDLKEDPSEEWLFPPSVIPAPLEFETHSSARSLSACTLATFLLVTINIR